MATYEDGFTFNHPGSGHVLSVIVCGQIVYAWLLHVEFISLENTVTALWALGILAASIVFALVLELQRFELRGTGVRVRNSTTGFLWWCFDLEEVVAVTYVAGLGGGNVQRLDISLKPSAHRSWETARLLEFNASSIDAPAFIAFMRAACHATQGLKVDRLPPDYAGVLRRTGSSGSESPATPCKAKPRASDASGQASKKSRRKARG